MGGVAGGSSVGLGRGVSVLVGGTLVDGSVGCSVGVDVNSKVGVGVAQQFCVICVIPRPRTVPIIVIPINNISCFLFIFPRNIYPFFFLHDESTCCDLGKP